MPQFSFRSGTRISLDSIVYAFNRGAAPESIKQAFPLLTLEEIYSAIDRRTLPYHLADFIIHHTSPGVFIVAQKVGVCVAIEGLLLMWTASDSEEWINLIVELPL